MVSKFNLILTTEEERKRIYAEHKINDEILNKAVEDVLNWYKFQPHLPKQTLDKNYIKTALLSNKMSIEKTKSKVEMKCVLRGVTPEMFDYANFNKIDLKRSVKDVMWVPLPRLSSDLSRITILKFSGSPEECNLEHHFKKCFMIGDYRVRKDCCLTDTLILDLQHLKLGHFTKFNPFTIKKAEISNSKAYGLRISGLYILNAPSYVDKIIALLKQSLSTKLANRIKSFSTIEELYGHVDRSILPVEYGGDEKSVEELAELWYKKITNPKWKKILEEESKLKSDESKRLTPFKDEDILGIQGTFKKLEID